MVNYIQGQSDMCTIAQLPSGVTLLHSTKTIFGTWVLMSCNYENTQLNYGIKPAYFPIVNGV